MQHIKDKHQLWIVGGGETFPDTDAYLHWIEHSDFLEWMANPKKMGDWKAWIRDGLADTHDTLRLPMPDKNNAHYEAWKLVFDRFVDMLDTNLPLTLVAHSLGGIFLAKYLSENTLPRTASAVHLVAPVWTHPTSTLHNTASFSFDPEKLGHLAAQTESLHIWASRDDSIVNFEDAEKYHESLPSSILHAFDDRGHFLGSHFVELFTLLLDASHAK